MRFLSAHLAASLGVSREYHFVQLPKTWAKAQSYCRDNFADLATIETIEDWERVRKIMESADGLAWIGLYHDINSWRWSIDNTYLYSKGKTGFGEWFEFTNRASGLCVEIVGQTLYDRPCSYLQKSVCYDSEYHLLHIYHCDCFRYFTMLWVLLVDICCIY